MDIARNDRREEFGLNRQSSIIDACRNLHADEEGPKTLTSEIEKIISALTMIPKPDALICSLDNNLENTVPLHQPARRGPPGAKRRAWQKKAHYQRSRCPIGERAPLLA